MIAKDINLLPEELREKDRRDKDSIRKKPKRIDITMSSPRSEQKPEPLKQPKPSLLSRLFSASVKPAKPLPPREPRVEVEAETGARQEVKQLHIPSVHGSKKDVRVDLLSGGFLFGKKEQKPEPLPPAKEEDRLPSEARESSGEEDVRLRMSKSRGSKRAKSGGFWSRIFKRSGQAAGGTHRPASDKDVKETKDRKHRVDIDVNLIPADMSKSPEFELPRKTALIGVSTFFALLFIAVGYLGIIWYQIRISREIALLEFQIVNVNTQIDAMEQERENGLALQQQLKYVSTLLDTHLYWTKFFEMLERHTVDEVYYTNFGMSGTKDVTLSAVGTGYRAAARQLVAFQQAEDFAQDVSINGATAELDLEDPSVVSVNFTVNLRLQDGVFEDPISSQP